MKKFLLILCLWVISPVLYAASMSGTPGVDFGTVAYVTNGTGTSSVTITPTRYDASASAAGTGGNLGGYSPSNVTITPIQIVDMAKNYWMFMTLNNTSSYTVSTPGCGTLSITNVSLHTHNTTAQYRYKITNATTLVNAENGVFIKMTVALTDFNGAGTCTISGAIPFGWEQVHNNPTFPTSYNYMVSITIVPPVFFTHDQGAKLDFGQLCFSTNPQTVTVSPAGGSSGSSLACPLTGTISADSFTVSASNTVSYTVTLPSSPITLSRDGSQDTLTVDSFASSCSGSCSVGSSGSSTFTVGGTLHVPGGTSAGEYTGTYPVSITY